MTQVDEDVASANFLASLALWDAQLIGTAETLVRVPWQIVFAPVPWTFSLLVETVHRPILFDDPSGICDNLPILGAAILREYHELLRCGSWQGVPAEFLEDSTVISAVSRYCREAARSERGRDDDLGEQAMGGSSFANLLRDTEAIPAEVAIAEAFIICFAQEMGLLSEYKADVDYLVYRLQFTRLPIVESALSDTWRMRRHMEPVNFGSDLSASSSEAVRWLGDWVMMRFACLSQLLPPITRLDPPRAAT
jgi:hypothetical protein